MRRCACFAVLAVSLLALGFGDEPGRIWVRCVPGVLVFLDGDLKGITVAEINGIILDDIDAGRHVLVLSRRGAQPYKQSVTAMADEIVLVQPDLPDLRVPAGGLRDRGPDVGLLRVESLSVRCMLDIKELGLSDLPKGRLKWDLDGVPTGDYAITAKSEGISLACKTTVRRNRVAEVVFDLTEGKVRDVGEERRHAEATVELQLRGRMAWAKADAKTLGLVFPPGWSFVPLRPGSFTMGSPPVETDAFGEGDESAHKVTLTHTIWMSAYETTQAQYSELTGRNPSFGTKAPRYPVVSVTWDDVQGFIGRLNKRERQEGRLPMGWAYRLPTEAEWEYGCRAGSSAVYCYGNEGPLWDFAWYNGSSRRRHHAVGGKRPNAWGLYDMHGNVWEWCQDWYAGRYPRGKQLDPLGPQTGKCRVTRGGSWLNAPQNCRSAVRSWIAPSDYTDTTGFRVVLARSE